MTLTTKTGTLEWAVKNVNVLTGCSHNCRYCYARGMARRFGRCGDWAKPVLRSEEVTRNRHRASGRLMFPSTHDIEPEFLGPCVTVLGKLLAAGNEVLIVSKPHLTCIERICTDFGQYKDTILFRFSIGTFDNSILKFWEPGAPSYEERLACLRHAFDARFQTSVSAEPMLDMPHAVELFYRLVPFVSDTVWIGKMNRPRNCIQDWRPIDAEIRQIEANQTDDKILAIYETLKGEPKVAWKDSIKKVIERTSGVE